MHAPQALRPDAAVATSRNPTLWLGAAAAAAARAPLGAPAMPDHISREREICAP